MSDVHVPEQTKSQRMVNSKKSSSQWLVTLEVQGGWQVEAVLVGAWSSVKVGGRLMGMD